MSKYQVSVLPHDNLIECEGKIKKLLAEMHKHLVTPADKRDSFSAIHLIHDISDLQRELSKTYKYTDTKPENRSSLIWSRDPDFQPLT